MTSRPGGLGPRVRRHGRRLAAVVLVGGVVVVTVAAVLELWPLALGVLAAMHVAPVLYVATLDRPAPARRARDGDATAALRELRKQIQNLDVRTTSSIERLRGELLDEAEELPDDRPVGAARED